MDKNEILSKAGQFFSESTREGIEQSLRPRIEQARQDQRDHDIICATRSYVFLKLTDDRIMTILSKFFKVRLIEDAQFYIKKARIKYQIDAIEELYVSQGHTRDEFLELYQKRKIEEKLDTIERLRYLPADKLLREFEKN